MLQTESTVDMSIWGRVVSSRTWRTLRTATWLEWQSQGNWTNPWLFLLYLVAKPLTSALVLIFMYWVISGFSSHGGLFGFLIVGSAAWNFVEQLFTGLPIAVLDDREQYAMLKYVYIAPQSFVMFLIGRSMPRILAGFLSFVIILSFGVVILGVPIDLRHVNYLLLVFTLIFGFLAIGAMAIALAGLVLMMQRGAWTMPEAMTGALYVVAGVIFPLGILPGWVEKIALVMPLTVPPALMYSPFENVLAPPSVSVPLPA